MAVDQRPIHNCSYSSHNSLQILCDQSWTTPKWGPESGMTPVKNVYESDDDRLYTFEASLVTCPACTSPTSP